MNGQTALCLLFRDIWNFSTVGPAETSSDNSDVRRPIHLAVLLVVSFLSGTAIHGQTQEEFIAGCAVGAFDSFSALKANCPPRTQAQVIDVRPAFTPQQLAEMNKYAQEGAAALQQYLNKQSISTVQPAATRTNTTPSNTPKNQASDEVFVYHHSTLPSTPPSGGALTGIAKAASQYQQNASSRALADAQRELYEAEREMAESTEHWKFVINQHAVMKAGLDGVSAALAAGAPLVKEGLTLAEAKALEKRMHLNASQVHIFPADLEPFDSEGEIRLSHGMPVEYFRYTLVGDVNPRAKQDSVKPQVSQAISESAPNAARENPNAENGDVAFQTVPQGEYMLLSHFVRATSGFKYEDFIIGYGNEILKVTYGNSRIGTHFHDWTNPDFSPLPPAGVPILSCTMSGNSIAVQPTPEPCMAQTDGWSLRYEAAPNGNKNEVTFTIYGRSQRPKSEAPKQREAQEAYDRCIGMNDESHQMEIDAGRGGKENDRRWLRARAYCRVNLSESLDQIMKDLDAAGLGR